MFVSKAALPRRAVLRGFGATLALPLLEAMVPAFTALAATAAKPVPRMGFMYIPNGSYLPNFFPTTVGTDFEFSPALEPLEPLRQHINIISGLCNRDLEEVKVGGGIHTRVGCSWLSGISPKKTEGSDLHAGTSIDQMAAATIGKDTPLTSLETALEYDFVVGSCDFGYACVYKSTFSWKAPTMPMPMESNPRAVFERLFGDGGNASEWSARLRQDRSVLDRARNEMARLQKGLGSSDRRAVDEYLDSVRSVEQRIQRAEKHNQTSDVPVIEIPTGIPDAFDEHAKLLLDLQYLAYQADITRVVSLQVGRELTGRPYPFIGVPDGHHAVSHHMMDPINIAKGTKINAYHASLWSYLIEKMRNTPEGDGSLLDNSILVFGAGMGDSDHHTPVNMPTVVAGGGGGIKGGRHLQYPTDTPFMNLGVTLLDKVGCHVDKIANSTGRLTDL